MDPASLDVVGRLLASLTVIVGALLAVRWWGQRTRGPGAAPVRVVARSGLAKGAAVVVVDAGGRRFLLGAGDHGVSLLAELDAGAGATEPGTATSASRPAGRNFIDQLRSMTVRSDPQGLRNGPPA